MKQKLNFPIFSKIFNKEFSEKEKYKEYLIQYISENDKQIPYEQFNSKTITQLEKIVINLTSFYIFKFDKNEIVNDEYSKFIKNKWILYGKKLINIGVYKIIWKRELNIDKIYKTFPYSDKNSIINDLGINFKENCISQKYIISEIVKKYLENQTLITSYDINNNRILSKLEDRIFYKNDFYYIFLQRKKQEFTKDGKNMKKQGYIVYVSFLIMYYHLWLGDFEKMHINIKKLGYWIKKQ